MIFAERVQLLAGPFTRSASSDLAADSVIESSQWPPPEPSRQTAEGEEGAPPIDEASYPNRTITFVLTSEQESGELGCRAWVQAWQQIAAAASRAADATLVATHSLEETLTFDVVKASFAPELAHEHWLGHAKGTLTIEARPFGSAPARTLAGAVIGARTGRWESTAVVPGDVEALASVRGVFADPRREARAAVYRGASLTLDIDNVAPGWADAATYSYGPIPYGAVVPIQQFEVPVDGQFVIDTRVKAFLPLPPDDQKGVLRRDAVGGSIEVNGISITQFTLPLRGPDTKAWTSWRRIRAPKVSLRAGDIVTVSLGVPDIDLQSLNTCTANIAYVLLRDEAYAALVSAGEPTQRALIVGDTFNVAGTGPVDSRTGSLGGTWSANGAGWVVEPGQMKFTGVGSPGVQIGLGAGLLPLSLTVRVVILSAPYKFTFAIERGAEEDEEYDDHVLGGIGAVATESTLGGYVSADSEFVAGADTVTEARAQSLPVGTYDVTISVDEAGRWVRRWRSASGVIDISDRGHCAMLEQPGIHYFAYLEATSSLRIQSVRFMSAIPLTDGLTWGRSQDSGAQVSGSRPRLRPGEIASISFSAADTDLDSPLAPNPTAMVVTAIPRYLQLPPPAA